MIVPTLNERANIEPLLARLETTLGGLRWEAVFVDDDSPDGTWELLQALQRERPHVRALRRVGRRGLASACIEGMLATSAPYLAVIDADMQHDECILPTMLATLRARRLDVVVGTRFAGSGNVGELGRLRRLISRLGRLLSRAVSRADLSDPMSGFFVVDRDFFEETVGRLSPHGFKILLDLFASAPRTVRFAEVPYRFRQRQHGESKLGALVLLDYLMLIGDKLFGRYVPVRFVVFVLFGLLSVLVHLAVLGLCFRGIGMPFSYAQTIALLVAMAVHLNLDNAYTSRNWRLRGLRLLYGHLGFYLICGIGAFANLLLARTLFDLDVPWPLAGTLGALVSAVWNQGVSATLTWRRSA